MSEENKPNYKIVTLDENLKKHLVCKFYAKDDKEANEYLVKTYSNASVKHYWERYCPIRILEDDGSIHEYDDHESYLSEKKENIFKKAWKWFTFNLWYYFIDRPRSFWLWAKSICFLLKNKIEKDALWDFDEYLLKQIKNTLPRLMEDRVGISPKFIDMALLELHRDDKKFDLKKYHENHCSSGYPKDVEDLADKLMVKTYNDILLHIELYRYYNSYGIIDFNNPKEVEFDKKWRVTLPIIEGSYDEVDDDKMNSLIDQEWNAIWEMMKEYGRTMWD